MHLGQQAWLHGLAPSSVSAKPRYSPRLVTERLFPEPPLCDRSTSQPTSPPHVLDPTYRKPPTPPAAGRPAVKQAATVRPQHAEQISKSKLAEDIKQKLLAEV